MKRKVVPVREQYARKVWLGQRDRCSNPKNKLFKYYGAKGVQVKYCVNDFIKWWVAERAKRTNGKFVVGRIDHDGHYEFGNIEMVESGENTREMLRRTGGNAVGVPVVLVGEQMTHVFCSASKAAKFLGTRHSVVLERIETNTKKPKPWKRKYPYDFYTFEQFFNLEATSSQLPSDLIDTHKPQSA